MAQRNIDFGTFPDDPDADAIRTAFQKVQENFGELFAGVDTGSVISTPSFISLLVKVKFSISSS